MKKKFFSSNVKGIYVVSLVLGVMYALIVGLVLNEFCCEVANWEIRRMEQQGIVPPEFGAAEVWWMMPLLRMDNLLQIGDLCYRMWVIIPLAIAAVILSVMLIEGRGGAAWRTKQLQAISVAWAILMVDLALSYADYAVKFEDFMGWLALVPVIILIIPLMILKRIRVLPKESRSKWIPGLSLP